VPFAFCRDQNARAVTVEAQPWTPDADAVEIAVRLRQLAVLQRPGPGHVGASGCILLAALARRIIARVHIASHRDRGIGTKRRPAAQP
jgi:hypothetical protein